MTWKERRKDLPTNRVLRLVYWVEWLTETAAFKLRQWALLDVLQRVGSLGVLIAVVTWFVTWPQRTEQTRVATETQRRTKILQAWQLLTMTQGKPNGGAGASLAINNLAAEGEILGPLDVSGGALLRNLHLADHLLDGSNFSRTRLVNPDFRGAHLQDSDFTDAIILGVGDDMGTSKSGFGGAWLTQSKLARARFANLDMPDVEARMASAEKASFVRVDARRARFDVAKLAGTEFTHVWLDDASFVAASLNEVNFKFSRLDGTDLRWSDLNAIQIDAGTSVKLANIAHVKNLSPEMRSRLLARGAVEIEDDREWERLKTSR